MSFTRNDLERVAVKLITLYKPMMIAKGRNGVHSFGFMKTKHINQVFTRDPHKPPKWNYAFLEDIFEQQMLQEHALNESYVVHITNHLSNTYSISEVFVFRKDIFDAIQSTTQVVVVVDSKHVSGCANCGKNQNIKMCSRCKNVVYCCTDCQKEHWKAHKPACDQIYALRKSLQSQ